MPARDHFLALFHISSFRFSYVDSFIPIRNLLPNSAFEELSDRGLPRLLSSVSYRIIELSDQYTMFSRISRSGIDIAVPMRSLKEAEKRLGAVRIIWFTDQLDLLNQSNQIESDSSFQLFIGLQKTPQHVGRAVSLSQCFQLLQQYADVEIFLIITANMPLDESALSQLRSFLNVKYIYHFGSALPWKKTVGDVHRGQNHFLLPKSCLNILPDAVHTKALCELDAETQIFIVQQLLLELLVRHRPDEKAKDEFLAFCRVMYRNDEARMKQIDSYEQKIDLQTSIQCYTEKTFAPSTLNKILRSHDLIQTFQIRYFICDLYSELLALHQSQWPHLLDVTLILYRGKSIPRAEFEELQRSVGKPVVVNSFLSATFDKDVALYFVDETDHVDAKNVAVIFCMEIDPEENFSKPLASIRACSQKKDENEFLLSMGIIFKIQSIKKNPVRNSRMMFHVG